MKISTCSGRFDVRTGGTEPSTCSGRFGVGTGGNENIHLFWEV
jgi:hypothetical protein